MDVVADASGKPVCRVTLDGTDPNCVPYNIWSLGKVTPEALAYLQTPGFQKGYTNQQVFGATLSGDLSQYGMKLPSAASGVGVAFGVERRVEQLELTTDTAFTTGDLFGQGGPTLGVAGKYTVDDVFGELRVPLIDRKPMAYALNVNASYRHSSYSTGHNTDTYGTGIEWSPVKSVKFRGSAQQAVRAANIVEMFTGQGLGLYNMDTDPCAGTSPTATLAQCARTGVTAAQYGTGSITESPAGQYNAIFGGNPSLKPETAKSFTLGVVANPIKDLTVSVDYFSVKLDDAIGTLPSPTVLSKCLETGDAKYCGLIQRDKGGSLWAMPEGRIIATNLNIGSLKTDGVDLGADYSFKLGSMGKLDVSFLGTILNDSSQEPIPGDGSYNCAGYYGSVCGTPQPKWRHKLRGSWATPWGVNAALTWRHFDGVSVDTSSSNPLLKGTVHSIVAKLPAMDYLDVTASYKIGKNLTLNAGINNLLDKDPPVANTGAPYGNGNTYPVVYDALGRRVTLSLSAKF
jgi:outer membrane receptor protein involved in Fe transport